MTSDKKWLECECVKNLWCDDRNFIEKAALDEAQAKIEQLVEALREAIGYVETSIPEPSHFGSCTPETFCDMTCSEIFHTSNLIYKIKNLLSKHHGERQAGDE